MPAATPADHAAQVAGHDAGYAPAAARTAALPTVPAAAPARSAPDAAPTGAWPVAGASLAPVASGPGPADGRADARGAAVAPRLPAGGAPVRPLPRRTGLAVLGWLAVSAVGAVTPAGGAAVVLLWAALARSAQWSRVAAAMSRARSGRLGAGARTALTVVYPFRLLGALAASAGYLVVGALVVSPLLLVAAAVLLRGTPLESWTTVRAVLWQDPVPSVLVALAAVLVWVGPGGRAVRHGSRALTEPVARHRNGRLVLAGLAGLVVVAAVLVVTAGL